MGNINVGPMMIPSDGLGPPADGCPVAFPQFQAARVANYSDSARASLRGELQLLDWADLDTDDPRMVHLQPEPADFAARYAGAFIEAVKAQTNK